MNKQIDHIIKGGIIRTPLLSKKHYENITTESIFKLMKNQIVRDAILLSSPVFLDQFDKLTKGKIKDKKKIDLLLTTAYKYVSRLSARSTPFGLFGNVNYLDVIDNNDCLDKQQSLSKELNTYARLDLVSIRLIIENILYKTDLKSDLSYKTNNSIFSVGHEYRYYEQINNGNEISYSISKVEKNDVLTAILNYCKQDFKTINQILNYITANYSDYDKSAVKEFIYDLVSEKIICSSLETVYTNSTPLEHLIFLLEKEGNKSDSFLKLSILKLKEVKKILCSELSVTTKFHQIYSYLKDIGITPNRKDILHLDSSKKTSANFSLNLNQKDRNTILEIKNFLSNLVPNEKDRFKNFKKRFISRYGDTKMPLLFVLDPEFGIGYKSYSENLDVDSLQKGIPTGENKKKEEIEFSKVEILLMNLVLDSRESNSSSIDLKSKKAIFPKGREYLKSNFSAFLSVISENSFYLDSFTSSSASRLLNRFAHLDKKIESLCKSILDFEKESKIIKAEIRHIFDLKTDSIFKYNDLFEFEIPCISAIKKNVKVNNINLTDIFISVRNNRIILTSNEYNEEIIPTLSEAKNYQDGAIDLFKFLADFQFQNNLGYISFSWSGLLSIFNKFPRLTYDNFVISPQLWILSKKEIKTSNDIDLWRSKNNVPKNVFMSKNYKDDNKLIIDFESPICLNILIIELAKHKRLFLTEVLLNDNSLFTDLKANAFHNEIIIPFLTSEKTKEIKEIQSLHELEQGEHIYFPSDKWVYFKVYCNHIVVEELLCEYLKPFINDLLDRSIISSSFFVRYYDEDFHLRIRFSLKDSTFFSVVVQEFNTLLKFKKSNYIIYKITIDTYQREIDRYGLKTINHCENIFFHDSIAVLEFLPFANSKNRIVFAVKGINQYLDDFGFNLVDKIEILKNLTNAFFYEFKITKEAKKMMDKRYRLYRNLIFKALLNNEQTKQEFEQFNKILLRKSKRIAKMVEAINNKTVKNSKRIDICCSLIHLFLNRLFKGNHRKQEMIIYYFLFKHFGSIKAIEKKKNKLYV